MPDASPRLADLVRDAIAEVDDWIVDHPGEDPSPAIREISVSQVSPMTTVLFSMVVADNSLAFLETDVECDTPFQHLFNAIVDEVQTQVQAHVDASSGDDDDA